ncbi:hypothetical protein PVAP13_1KG487000 [Panicum virgatum]|uniref:Hydrophobic seed protein domain-containing protein n=1 Tax=Panicum virgatum TaxID=38727 RepID=A0A8T0XG22_PANVG|nr:hypothetical protein PVAP13_1KG487000 [Panicum virgatum]
MPTPPTPSTPTTPTTPGSVGQCPINALKLGVCADVLGLIKAQVGTPLEAAICLCTPSRPTCSASSSTSPSTSASSLTTAARTCPAASSAD